MKLSEFAGLINALEIQHQRDEDYAKMLSGVLKTDIECYDNSALCNAVFKILQKHYPPMPASQCLIEMFCYEFRFGKAFRLGDIREDEGGDPIDIGTIEKLHAHLEKQKNG